MLPPISLNVPSAAGTATLSVAPGKPLLIVGRNGAGKSALIHRLAGQFTNAIYLPGGRPSYFGHESASLTPETRRQLGINLQNWNRQPDTRWQQPSGTSRNEKAVHDLTTAEIQFKLDAANEIKRDGKESSAIARLQSGFSPLDRVNAILSQSNLPITVVVDSAEMKTVRGDQMFSVARASDGERIALVLACEVVAAPDGSLFLIDEPELHLHRAIIVPLLAGIVRENPDSTFIISTHELELVSALPDAAVAVIRNCSWPSLNDCRWDVDEIPSAGSIPEDLRVDILGSRRKILFIEGTNTSLDAPLYALLFPSASIRSRENCREVERAVAGLLATKDIHHAEAVGMVDGDNMSPEQISGFQAKNIYPLPVYSVESLYYAEEVILAVAGRQAETFGTAPEALVAEARAEAVKTLIPEDTISHLASKVAERAFRDALLQNMPQRSDLIAGTAGAVSVTVPSTFPAEVARLRDLRDNHDVAGIVSRYPVRESGFLNALARGLKFPDRTHYEKAALRLLSVDENLRVALRAKLGALAQRLAQNI